MARFVFIFVMFVFLCPFIKGQEKDSVPHVFLLRASSGLNFRIIKDIPGLQELSNTAYPYIGVNGLLVFRNGFKTKATAHICWQRYVSVSPSFRITNMALTSKIQPGLEVVSNLTWYSGFFYNSSLMAVLTYRTYMMKNRAEIPPMPDEYGWCNGFEMQFGKYSTLEFECLLSFKYLSEPMFFVGFNRIIVTQPIKKRKK